MEIRTATATRREVAAKELHISGRGAGKIACVRCASRRAGWFGGAPMRQVLWWNGVKAELREEARRFLPGPFGGGCLLLR